MKIYEFDKIIEDICPSSLKESYDNVGLMVGEMDMEINSILLSLDCTLNVIDEAISQNCNLILNHHPLLFKKPSNITDKTLTGKKIIKLIKNNIGVYSIHTNLDSVNNGLNDILISAFNLSKYNVEIYKPNESLTGGIGRIVTLNEKVTLQYLLNKIKESLGINHLIYSGDHNKVINKILIINGSGESYLRDLDINNFDLVITGDTSYHTVSSLLEEGIAVIDAGHFNTEWLPFIKFSKTIETRTNLPIIISRCSTDCYNIYGGH